MKKTYIIFLFAIALLFMTTNANAQIRYGIKGGIQYSNVLNVHYKSIGRFPSFLGGGIIQFPIQGLSKNSVSNNFYINVEVLYTQQGEKGEKPDSRKILDYKKYSFYQDFINVPVLFRAYLPGDYGFFAEIGPQLAFRVSQKNKDIDAKSKSFNIDASIGVGYSFGQRYEYEIGLRLNYGLMDMYKDVDKVNNHANVALTFAYLF